MLPGMKVQVGRIVGSEYDSDDFLGVQIDAYGEDKSGSDPIQLFGWGNMVSRPLDRDQDNAGAHAFYMIEGTQGYAWCAHDPQLVAKLPQIQKGEAFFFGPTGAFVRMHVDGRISLFTTDDTTVNGHSVSLTLAPTGLTYNFPHGRLTFDGNGFHVLHSSGARIDLNAIAGLPTPLDALASIVSISGATVRVEGSAISLGTAAGIAEPAAKATDLLLTLQAMQAATTTMQAACVALSAAVTAIAGVPANSAAGAGPAGAAATLVGAAATAVTAAGSAVTAALATVPSGSTMVS